MFKITADKSIYLTRGDAAIIETSAKLDEETHPDEIFLFNVGDKVRFLVFEKNRHENVVLQKDIDVSQETATVDFFLTSEDTRIGPVINKPKDYWYEIELNPDTPASQTLLGYDIAGPKIFRLYPEGVVEE